MATSSIPPPTSLPANTTTEPITVHRLTSHTSTPFNEVITRFRTLVPQVDLKQIISATTAEGIEQAMKATGTTSEFVLFAEFNHGRWIRHFPASSSHSSGTSEHFTPVHGGRACSRFVFGNPLIAITMIREDVEAGLHVPVECMFVEQDDGSTKMVMILPGGLIGGHEQGKGNEALKRAVGALEEKVVRLIGEIMQS